MRIFEHKQGSKNSAASDECKNHDGCSILTIVADFAAALLTDRGDEEQKVDRKPEVCFCRLTLGVQK